MNVQFTARHFKAHEGLKQYAMGQIETLKKMNIKIAQGYYYSKAVPAFQLKKVLREISEKFD